MNKMFPAPTAFDGAVAPSLYGDADGFRSIFENAPSGMLLVAEDGSISAANFYCSQLFGYRQSDMLGMKVGDLLPQRSRDSDEMQGDEFAIESHVGESRALMGERKDGTEIPLEMAFSRVETSHGDMTCITILDMTERHRSELRLKEANAQLEEFTYVASHDLRSPIRGIANLIEFIREDFDDGEMSGMIKNIDRMEKRVHAVEKLIDDLLTYARAGRRAVEVEEMALADVFNEIVALEQIPNGVTIELDAPDDSFVGARTPLTTVLRNLLANAIKHHDREDGHIAITARFEGNLCLIDVCDDGPGIPENARERVFRLFQTLKASERSSSGLGLAVAQRLATGHGGQLTLLPSSQERGTCFRVTWPRYKRTDLDG